MRSIAVEVVVVDDDDCYVVVPIHHHRHNIMTIMITSPYGSLWREWLLVAVVVVGIGVLLLVAAVDDDCFIDWIIPPPPPMIILDDTDAAVVEWLIVILLCRAESRPVDGSYWIKGSVFSEALDAPVTIVMYFAALQEVCFWILPSADQKWISCSKCSNFASSTAGRTKLRLSFVDDNGTNR